MRKTLVILLSALILTGYVNAGVVTPEMAALCAGSMLGADDMPLPENTGASMSAGRNGRAQYQDYYVCNKPGGGWVIVAADDRVKPIIAYSETGSFSTEDMPANLKCWMDDISECIDEVRDNDLKATDDVKAEWERLLGGYSPERTESKVIETALWYQFEPYNIYCPVATGENKHAATGCVATAMAIVLRHNKWPAHGKGVIGGYRDEYFNAYVPSYSIDNHYYDWDNMPMSDGEDPKNHWTDENKHQVAQLMHDCGVMVEMDYSYEEGSASSLGLIAKALIDHMYCSESMTAVDRSSFELTEWFSLFRNEIDNDRLAIYRASDGEGGHAFVCDGYETAGNRLHFNWGWGDYDGNGFYSLEYMHPKGSRSTFSDYHCAVIGIAPDTANVDLGNAPDIIFAEKDNSYGMTPFISDGMKVDDITKGSDLYFIISTLKNMAPHDVARELKICLEGIDGTVKQEGWFTPVIMGPADGNYHYVITDNDVLNVTPELTDLFRLYIKNSDDTWMPVSPDYSMNSVMEGVVCGVTYDPLIIIPDNVVADESFELTLTYGCTPRKGVEWSVNGQVCPNGMATLVKGKNVIKANVDYSDGSTGTIYKTVNIDK